MFNEKKSKTHFIVEILVELDYYVGVWVRCLTPLSTILQLYQGSQFYW